MHFSSHTTIAAFAALSAVATAQSASEPLPLEDRWDAVIDQGRNNWTIAFPNKSPKSYAEVNATSDISFLNPQLFYQLSEGLHNDYRAEHNGTELEWNVTLAAAAANHAEMCIFEHTENNPYGENLVAGYANMSASLAAWADERDLYDWNNPKFDEKTGHFTQMVWTNTTQFGCGRCYCGGGGLETGGDGTDKAPGWMVVCEYSPPGNFEGQFKENVLKGSYVKGAASGLVAQSGLVMVTVLGVAVALLI